MAYRSLGWPAGYRTVLVIRTEGRLRGFLKFAERRSLFGRVPAEGKPGRGEPDGFVLLGRVIGTLFMGSGHRMSVGGGSKCSWKATVGEC